MSRKHLLIAVAFLLLFQITPALAQQEISLQSGESPDLRIARLEAQVQEAKSAGDNAWMLVSSALV